jgi:hypothetical protein
MNILSFGWLKIQNPTQIIYHDFKRRMAPSVTNESKRLSVYFSSKNKRRIICASSKNKKWLIYFSSKKIYLLLFIKQKFNVFITTKLHNSKISIETFAKTAGIEFFTTFTYVCWSYIIRCLYEVEAWNDTSIIFLLSEISDPTSIIEDTSKRATMNLIPISMTHFG